MTVGKPKPELLSPAGTRQHLRYAFAYGADAVYAGPPRYSLRVRQNDFDKLEHLAEGLAEAHAQGKKFYVTCNIYSHQAKLKTFLSDFTPVVALQPDALIMADPGLILLAREQWPTMPIHLSVQANTVNAAAVKFWQERGLTRVILSRELSLEEIAEIRQQCPDMELEVFVHGALCIAYSGRCLLSGYFNHRDANQGACTNACRWNYQVHPARQDETGGFLLEEKLRPGEYLPIEEDEHGTYIMNSKDLRAVQHLAQLMAIGIDSFKIEGRTKSHYYVARTAQIYRQAIEAAWANKPFETHLLTELENLANRGYTEGFFRRHTHDHHQNYELRNTQLGRQQWVGEVMATVAEQSGWLTIEVKNHFAVGDQLELLRPQGNLKFQLTQMENTMGIPITVAPGSGHQVNIKTPVLETNVRFGLLVRTEG